MGCLLSPLLGGKPYTLPDLITVVTPDPGRSEAQQEPACIHLQSFHRPNKDRNKTNIVLFGIHGTLLPPCVCGRVGVHCVFAWNNYFCTVICLADKKGLTYGLELVCLSSGELTGVQCSDDSLTSTQDVC